MSESEPIRAALAEVAAGYATFEQVSPFHVLERVRKAYARLALAAGSAEPHPDDVAVDALAVAMKARLHLPLFAAPTAGVRPPSAPATGEPVVWLATALWNARETWTCPADIEKQLSDRLAASGRPQVAAQELLACRLYYRWVDAQDIRCPAWSELSQDERDDWLRKAPLLALFLPAAPTADPLPSEPTDERVAALEEAAKPPHAPLAEQSRSASPPATEPALHPATADLVDRFAAALKAKLAAAEKKYGYSDGWRADDWLDECRTKLLEHVAKGDPRDVAAYCAFLWHHGAATGMPAAPEEPAWRDMASAPLDNTLVRLLVKFDEHGIEETEEPIATIGAHNDGEWSFAGWDWYRDTWTRGSGDLLGWLPMLDAPAVCHYGALTGIAAPNAPRAALRPTAPSPCLSWNGYDVTGDEVSIAEVRRLVEFEAARPSPTSSAPAEPSNRGAMQAIRQAIAALRKHAKLPWGTDGYPVTPGAALVYEAESYLVAALASSVPPEQQRTRPDHNDRRPDDRPGEAVEVADEQLMGYANPLLKLPSMAKVLALPAEQRAPLEAMLRELRADADRLAEESWKKRKGPMAAYWRAVSTYARHTAHALSKA